MIVTRRGFLQSCLALAAAPAIVRADSLMRVIPRESPWIIEEIGYSEMPISIHTEWRQVVEDVQIVDMTNFPEIVAKVFRENHEQIAASVSKRNAMLAQMVGRK